MYIINHFIDVYLKMWGTFLRKVSIYLPERVIIHNFEVQNKGHQNYEKQKFKVQSY